MAVTRAKVKQIVLDALAYYKELMDSANAAKFTTKEQLQTEIAAIDVQPADLSEVESAIDGLVADVEGLKIARSDHAAAIEDLQSDVNEIKESPDMEAEEITYADVAKLFD